MCEPDCAHYTCLGCGHDACPDTHPSPGEADGICQSCYETEDVA